MNFKPSPLITEIIQRVQENLLSQHQDLLFKAIEQSPDNIPQLFQLGLLCAQNHRLNDALFIFNSLQSRIHDDARIPYNLGLIHGLQGNHQSALSAYDEALKIKPNDAETHINKGSIHNDLEQYSLAVDALEKAININSAIPEAWSNLGIALNNLRRYEEAISAYQKAISLHPHYFEAWSNQSVPLKNIKDYEKALESCNEALRLNSNYAEAWLNKGIILHDLKQYEQALTQYDQALRLKPDYAEAWSNKGITLSELKQHDQALAHFNEALRLKPHYAEAWSNKGNTLNELKQYDQALANYDEALRIKPDYAEAWSNKASSLNALKRYRETIIHYEKALSLKQDINWILGDLLCTRMTICSWKNIDQDLEKLITQSQQQKRVAQPFLTLALSDNPLLHQQCSEIFAGHQYPVNLSLGDIPKLPRKAKIRVGYFSADFHNHATGYLMAELFELHNKESFEIIAFSFGPKTNDAMRERLQKSFHQFIEVGNISDIEVAKLSRQLGIDIAVDLKGFTQDARARIFSYRAAPVQVNFLGYPGTMGSGYIDYILADQTIITTELRQYYSEKVLTLPHSYQPNDRKRVISSRQFTKQELGLPEEGFVFACFNNNYKITPSTFDSWMKILKSVDGSVLWLLEDNPLAAENLRAEAKQKGVESSRLIFAERMPLPEHLARHRQADLFLDTLPYNAHTTTSDALWAELPVLTLMGESFASRVSASLLKAIDLPELITTSQDQYESMAIELAKNPLKLSGIQQKLIGNKLQKPLFDTPSYTAHLESAYSQIYERYQADLPPDHINIE